MSDKIIASISNVQGAFDARKEILAKAASGETIPLPENTTSNFALLLSALLDFYEGNENAAYLPSTITTKLLGELNIIAQALTALPEDPADASFAKASTDVLLKMDSLYAYSLSIGIVTFGFISKEASNLVARVQGALMEFSKALNSLKSKATSDAGVFTKANEEGQKAIQESIGKLNQLVAEKQKAIDEALSQIVAIHAKASDLTGKVEGYEKTSKANVAATEQAKQESQAQAIESKKKADEILNQLNEITANSKAALKQSQDSASSTSALQNQASEAHAKLAAELKAISSFYAEIESHRNAMQETKKSADSKLGEMRTEVDAKLKDYGERSEKIVKQNEELQKEIRDHLVKAIGVSLFGAFEDRRSKLIWGKWVWAGILALSVSGAVGYGIWFIITITGLQNGIDPWVLLARLVLAAPIIFIIAFAASQYSKERMAEEEYAFKATISFSLEPYRELIERMAKHKDTADVKKLVFEIFDNPVKRLYGKSHGKGDEMKLDAEGVKEIVKAAVDVAKKAGE